jgi:hypothetical protein
VDITFSLECRDLQSNWGQEIRLPGASAVTQYEEDRQAGLPRGNDGVEYYDTGVRIAFNHGLPDEHSAFDVDNLRVVEVTQEGITLRGKTNAGASEEGYFDRRTGHGEITWYKTNWVGEGKDAHIGNPAEKVFKQFIYECKPSPPAKF